MAITRIGNPAIADQRGVNFRNIIINGGMDVAQRGTSASSVTATGYNTCDRFKNIISSLGTWTVSQSTDVPSGQGFSTSLKMDCTTADASPSASDFNIIGQLIEGQNLQYLKKGTSSSESLTLSFWVKATKTGTNICELYDVDNTRQISKSYTINSADTWEKKTLTFSGDTTGAFGNDNGVSLQLHFFLGAGSDRTSGTLNTSWNSVTTANRAVGQVNHADSTSNEWYVTGVQLETGQVASDFEFLPHDVNLRRCERYFEKFNETTGYHTFLRGQTNESSLSSVDIFFKQTMRATPSVTLTSTSNYTVENISIYKKGFCSFGTPTSSTNTARINGYEASAEL